MQKLNSYCFEIFFGLYLWKIKKLYRYALGTPPRRGDGAAVCRDANSAQHLSVGPAVSAVTRRPSRFVPKG